MNLGVLVIIIVAVLLIGLLVMPRVRGLIGSEKTTVERRSGADRRQRSIRVPMERRRRGRRADDLAREYVNNLS